MWRLLLGYGTLIFFVGAGIAHAISPDRFMKPWHRGGELLTESNRFGIRLFGLVLAGGALYILYNVALH
jgi:hypothetical protein